MNKKGFTIVELLIVIVVTGIIGGFAVFFASESIAASQEKADLNNLDTLNKATQNYILFEETAESDAFLGINSDLDRITELLTTGYIDIRVTPQQDSATFGWNVDEQEWQLFIDGNPYSEPSDGYDFNNITLEDAVNDGMYVFQENNVEYDETSGAVVMDPRKGKLLKSTTKDEYSFTVTWSTNNIDDTRIQFILDYYDETDLDKGEGYAILLRKNTNFCRLHRLYDGTRYSQVETYYYQDSGVIPSYQDDDGWYGETHTTRVSVSRVDANTKNVAIYIDGEFLVDFDYNQTVVGEAVYYGASNHKGRSNETYIYSIS